MSFNSAVITALSHPPTSPEKEIGEIEEEFEIVNLLPIKYDDRQGTKVYLGVPKWLLRRVKHLKELTIGTSRCQVNISTRNSTILRNYKLATTNPNSHFSLKIKIVRLKICKSQYNTSIPPQIIYSDPGVLQQANQKKPRRMTGVRIVRTGKAAKQCSSASSNPSSPLTSGSATPDPTTPKSK